MPMALRFLALLLAFYLSARCRVLKKLTLEAWLLFLAFRRPRFKFLLCHETCLGAIGLLSFSQAHYWTELWDGQKKKKEEGGTKYGAPLRKNRIKM